MSTVGEQTAAEQRLVEYCEGTRLSVNPWDIEAVLDARDTVESERDLLAAQVEAIKRAAVVGHKGPYDTDAEVMRSVADRLRRNLYPGGSNARDAAARVLDEVAQVLGVEGP